MLVLGPDREPRFVHGNSLNAAAGGWGGRTQKDLSAVHFFRPRDAIMSGQREAQRELDGMTDADAARGQDSAHAESIVAHLQRRFGVDEIEAVVGCASDPESLAQPAGSACKVAWRRVRRQAATASHLFDSG